MQFYSRDAIGIILLCMCIAICSVAIQYNTIQYNTADFGYRIAGFFPEVLIFSNFPNELLTQEILFCTADCFKRVNCVIMNSSIL